MCIYKENVHFPFQMEIPRSDKGEPIATDSAFVSTVSVVRRAYLNNLINTASLYASAAGQLIKLT